MKLLTELKLNLNYKEEDIFHAVLKKYIINNKKRYAKTAYLN